MAPSETKYDGPERRAPPSLGFGILVVVIIAGIGFATLCPIGLRPRLGDANLERFLAFYALGAALCLFVPRRWPAALAFVIFLAVSLEVGQTLAPGRDAHTADALIKALGGASGVMSISAAMWWARSLRYASTRPSTAASL